MSDTILKLIPSNPTFIPEEENIIAIRALLDADFNQVEIGQTENIEFIDQGSNFGSISCNVCGQLIKIDIWQDAMYNAHGGHYKDLTFTTSCCNQSTSLNDILYHSPAGFAKFCIAILNPSSGIDQYRLSEIERILGVSIKEIWARY